MKRQIGSCCSGLPPKALHLSYVKTKSHTHHHIATIRYAIHTHHDTHTRTYTTTTTTIILIVFFSTCYNIRTFPKKKKEQNGDTGEREIDDCGRWRCRKNMSTDEASLLLLLLLSMCV